jgi:LysM repeat protein
MPTYKVQAGDTLGKIAKKFYGDASRFSAIVAANSIRNPDKLKVGQELVIPDPAVGVMPVAVSPAPVPFISGISTPPQLNPTAHLNEQRLSGMFPALAVRARCMVELSAHEGIALLITQGLRTWEEQDALHAKGHTLAPLGKQYIVTNAKGGQSFHNFGLAFDIVVLDSVGKADWNVAHPYWKRSAEIGKTVGLEWGGDWKSFKDLPHFQYVGDLTIARCRELYASGLQAIWDDLA